MEMRQLRYFVAVSEHLNFSEAARSLGMAQPPLSIQIRKLEQELRCALFERRNRRVSLTAAGETFAKEARTILSLTQAAAQSAQDAAQGRAGRLTLGYTDGAALLSERLTRRLRKFLRKNRGLRLALQPISDVVGIDAPLDGVLTEMIASDVPKNAVVLETHRVAVALPPKHRLFGKTEIGVADLIGESLLLAPLGERSPAERILLARLLEANLPVAVESGPANCAHRLWQVSLGLGCAVLSSGGRPLLDAQLAVVTDCPESVATVLIPRAGTPPAALSALLDAIGDS